MRHLKQGPFLSTRFRTGTLAMAAFVLAGCFTQATALEHGQKRYDTAEDASQALFKAAQANDEKVLLEILGPDGRKIVSSGDDAEDAEARAKFVEKFKEMHRLVREPDGSTILYIGAENWPTPIPLKDKDGAWSFDTEAGKFEILLRRIGRNETSTIEICSEIASAQNEFRSTHSGSFATTIHSGAGQHDGLYWSAAEGEPKSPIGPLVASAVLKGGTGAPPTPYRGYCYRLLPAQDKGFTFLAYPVAYRSSGVMTFLVTEKGVVYEKDLGRGTARVGKLMASSVFDSTWKKVDGNPDIARP